MKKAGTFERFVKEWLPSRKSSSLDGLFRPQTYYLIDAAGGFLSSTLAEWKTYAKPSNGLSTS